MPTSEWNAATSSGIAVMGTRRAITAPVPPPIAMPTTTSAQAPMPAGGWEASVVTMAIAMPIMPNRLPPARLGIRQPTQRENEENAGDQIKQRDDIGGHRLAHFFFWYMPSMRCVTRNPPKMLTEAKVSATKPRTRAQIGPPSLATSATPTASSAPTTITDEIAFVTDISGVCKAGVTDHTT